VQENYVICMGFGKQVKMRKELTDTVSEETSLKFALLTGNLPEENYDVRIGKQNPVQMKLKVRQGEYHIKNI